MRTHPTSHESTAPPRRSFFTGDGPLFFGSLAFAIAAVVVYFIVISLGVRP